MRALASASRAKSNTRSIRGSIAPGGDQGTTSATKRGTAAARCALLRSLLETPNTRQALRMQRLEVDLGVHDAVDVADRREPALEGEGAQVLGEHRAADRVDDQVGAVLRRSPP